MKLFTGFLTLSIAESRRPNVILLNTDDFGIGDFQIYNREAKVPTPNIDRIGYEGVKFTDAHSGSSRCSPSRYMLMTGRYDMTDSEYRKIELGNPHIGEMFAKAGYKTGLFGKVQPLTIRAKNVDLTAEEYRAVLEEKDAFRDNMRERGWPFRNLRPGGDIPGIYEQFNKPAEFNYTYAFTNTFACCSPGGFYENGIGIEPVDTYVNQKPYPEHLTPEDYARTIDGRQLCSLFPSTGYMGPDTTTTTVLNNMEAFEQLPIYFCNFPRQNIAMRSFDSRHLEEMTIPKLEQFIDDNADEPFFAYYGMQSGHGPFGTPIRFRNQTEAGAIGEMIMEADEIVGKIFDRLEANGIADDTLLMWMTDNGPAASAEDRNLATGHNQRRVDLPDTSLELKGTKNSQQEAGHRTPFLWRYPRRFSPKTLDDPRVPVSTVDIYATLAELAEYELECNEAPDSRSLVSYLETGVANDELMNKPIMTHANIRGLAASLRKREWKYIPGSQMLYNMAVDPAEENVNNSFTFLFYPFLESVF